MRKPVLAFVLLCSTTWSLSATAASIPQSKEESLRAAGCPSDPSTLTDAKKKARCEAHAAQYKCNGSDCPTALTSTSTDQNALIADAIQKCELSARPAKTCCMSPDLQSCVDAGAGSGQTALNEYNEGVTTAKGQAQQKQLQAACSTMSGLSSKVETFSAAASGVCAARKDFCSLACDQVMKDLDTKCPGCSARVRERLKGNYLLCTEMNPRGAEQAARDFADTSKKSLACANNSGMKEQAAGDPSADPGAGDTATSDQQKKTAAAGSGLGSAVGAALANPALMQSLMGMLMKPGEEEVPMELIGCDTNPNIAGCALPVATSEDDPWKNSTGSGNMEDTQAQAGFNVADASDPYGTNDALGGGEPYQGQPASVGGVPNGGGGGIPQGGGGGAASLGGAGAGGQVPGAGAKTNTDIMQGFSSGGGGLSALNSGLNMKGGQDGGGYSYGAQVGTDRGNDIDLRAFLPGGAKDPTRKLAGNVESTGIQSSDVNIWARISQRIRSRCTQGLLRDCIP